MKRRCPTCKKEFNIDSATEMTLYIIHLLEHITRMIAGEKPDP